MATHQTIEIPIQGMDCADCTLHVKRAIAALPGVDSVEVFLASEKTVVGLDPQAVDLPAIRKAVAGAGYLVPEPESAKNAEKPAGLQDFSRTVLTLLGIVFGLVLFGLGVVPGLISTIIFALPAPIRLTQLGIASVPKTLREAGQAFGATPLQLLLKVELPSAGPMILAGITQCIMLSLSMVVIAALVGAGGLGVPVVRALNTVQVGMGFEAGLAIVLLAIMLDRISRPPDRKEDE